MTRERTEPPVLALDEATSLRQWIDYHRDTLRLKTDGLDAEQLATPLPPSTMTLGGLVKHLALVEESWLSHRLMGRPEGPPWDTVDWDADRDWDWHSAADDTPEQLRALFDRSVAASDAILDEVLAEPDGLDRRTVVPDRQTGDPFTLRWILQHLLEEYARHNGHADLLREAVDGTTGE